ncbi:sensor histidine kinase [Hyella patelloides]|nr:ATP-binding protein [Hyella patelloides]
MPFGQSSFRRILLSRLLLLSVPVLLLGVYVTYRKARSAFLETARQNLTESAVRKGESILQSIEALQTNMANASDAAILKNGSVEDHQVYIAQLAQILPTNILCVQLKDLTADRVTATTCGEIPDLDDTSWQGRQQSVVTTPEEVHVKLLLPPQSLTSKPTLGQQPSQNQLKLWLTAPVYDRNGRLRYALSVQSAILNQEKVEPGSLEGYPVVINQNGVILAHPFSQRVGRNIRQMPDAKRLGSLLQNAIAGEPNFLHLFYLEKDGVELLAGYSAISSPVTQDNQQKWIILAVTPIDAALLPLKDIRIVLFVMTIGLIAATSLATIYISKELARPLEKIRDYTLKEEHLNAQDRLVDNFQIREFNQLASAIDKMVIRLTAWGDEIVSAWKEAQNANKLKSEFLATTSHELRTPLNGIINCIRVVKEGYCDSKEEENDFLDQADDAAIHLLGIINDVLDISKIEAGKLSVMIEKVDLSKIINEVIDLQLVDIQQKNLELKASSWERKIYVSADGSKLKQILINIVGNAVKFTEQGKITIDINVINPQNAREKESDLLYSQLANPNLKWTSETDWQQVTDGSVSVDSIDNINNNEAIDNFSPAEKPVILEEVIIKVSDTGIGIELSQQEKLFRPFVMVDGSTTRKFGGTGLGLAISRNLIELMGGSIDLYSAGKGQGTTVTIRLPLKKESE